MTQVSHRPSTEQRSELRAELSRGEDRINKSTWAGSMPPEHAIAPRIRVGRDRWFNILWLIPIGFVLALVAIAVAQGLRTIPAVQDFIAEYPGTATPAGQRLPATPSSVKSPFYLTRATGVRH